MNQINYPFESVLVRNRLGKGINLQVYPFSISYNHVCVLIAMPEGVHSATLSKNAEHFAAQLRERFTRQVKTFTLIELQSTDTGEEVWYQWQFNWVGNMPLEPKSQQISLQKQQYYQGLIMGYDQAAGQR